MKHLPRVLAYLRPYTHLAVASIVLIVLGGLAALLMPWPLKVLVDNVLEHHPLPSILVFFFAPIDRHRTGLLIFAVVGGLAVTIVQSALGVLDNYVNTTLVQRMVLDFRSDLFQHTQRLSLAFHDERRTGDFMGRINSSAGAVGTIVMAVQPLFQSAITLVGMFWIAFRMDPELALLSLIIVPFLYYSVDYYTKHIVGRLREVKGMEGQSLSIIHEAMSMLRVIVAFGREDHEYRRFRNQGETAVNARVVLTVQQTLFSLAVNMITAIGTALVLGVGASHVLDGRLTVGQLLVVLAYIASVYSPLQAISSTIGSLQDQRINLERAMELLETVPEIIDAPGATAIERSHGHVVCERVSFAYKDREHTLEDVSFEASSGEVVAVVGQTGAGKTTLISLIPRFYDPQEGRILLDGVDISKLTLRSLRAQISLVLQEPLLFSGSLADNIRYGRLDATDDDVVEAARAANAHDFIMQLPSQYETTIGERGARLSGGERQRIAVARAFLNDAPILILDEPTSSIDSKTEAVILDALDRLMVGRTTFMIAHRLSTIRHADKILVLSHGRIVEQGSHDDLLRTGGLYKQLFDGQLGQAERRSRSHARPMAPADIIESRA